MTRSVLVPFFWRAVLSGVDIPRAALAARQAGLADELADALRLQIGADLVAGRGDAVSRKQRALAWLLRGAERRAA
jgi:hypothetical protein